MNRQSPKKPNSREIQIKTIIVNLYALYYQKLISRIMPSFGRDIVV